MKSLEADYEAEYKGYMIVLPLSKFGTRNTPRLWNRSSLVTVFGAFEDQEECIDRDLADR